MITNLISNAAKFSPDGSEIRIDGDAEPAHVRVSVTDSGPGIPEEFQTRIFQRFAQAEAAGSRKYAGTGLGLHISKMIVDLHGGEIGFDTEKGRGTTFWFRLPAAVPAPARAGRVLVLEAAPEMSARIRSVLEGEGATVSVVGSLAEAGALAFDHEFDAIALGSVPDADDAIEAVRHVHEYAGLKEAPVVVVSPGPDEDVAGVVRGLETWLRKPRELEYTPASVRALPERPVVLHVEDDHDLGRMVAVVIGPNFDTRTVHTVRDAESMIESESVDLMILDVDLVDGNELSLVAALHDRQPSVPVYRSSSSPAKPSIPARSVVSPRRWSRPGRRRSSWLRWFVASYAVRAVAQAREPTTRTDPLIGAQGLLR